MGGDSPRLHTLRATMMPSVCHVEWGTPDAEGLQRFLSGFYGWESKPLLPGYLIYLPSEGGASVGILKSDQMRAGGSPSASVRVPNPEAALEQAQRLGGKVVVPSTPMGTGAFAFIAAPDGNLVGLQQV